MRPALRRRRRSAGGGADAKIQKEKKKSQVKPAVPDRNGTVIRLISGLFAIEELLTEQFNEDSAKVTAATDRERSAFQFVRLERHAIDLHQFSVQSVPQHLVDDVRDEFQWGPAEHRE